DADRAVDRDAIIRPTPGEMRRIGARDQRLGRHAPRVDAGTAEELALDQRDLHAGPGEAPAERWPGLAGPDDDGVEGLGHGCGLTGECRARKRGGAPGTAG